MTKEEVNFLMDSYDGETITVFENSNKYDEKKLYATKSLAEKRAKQKVKHGNGSAYPYTTVAEEIKVSINNQFPIYVNNDKYITAYGLDKNIKEDGREKLVNYLLSLEEY